MLSNMNILNINHKIDLFSNKESPNLGLYCSICLNKSWFLFSQTSQYSQIIINNVGYQISKLRYFQLLGYNLLLEIIK